MSFLGFGQGPLVRIIYSTQLIKDENLSFEEMGKEIARISEENNKKIGVTGCLAVNADTGKAIQVIEGRKKAVERLFKKI